MDYVELSNTNLKDKCKELFLKVNKDFDYELVIFIARGSFIIGQELARVKGVELLEVKAQRKGGKLKKLLRPLFLVLPKKLLIKIRQKEMNSPVHEKNQERYVEFDKNKYENYKGIKRILLVDDSIDSGNSVLQVKLELTKFFKDSEIRVAVFNVMDKALIKPDYTLYQNTMIKGPWSSDSKENKEFIKSYEEWKRRYKNEG